MKVLVAGGTGFIGTNLCTELHERGHEVTALARDPGGSDLPAGVDRARGDVSAYDSIADAVSGHDAIVNLVSLSPLFQPPGGVSHEDVHLRGTENLVRAAEAGDVDRFIQMSGLDADPNAPTAFLRAKGKAENVVRESNLAWTIFRPSVVFGDGAEFVDFTKMLTTPYVTALPGGGETRFQPIWVGDLVPIVADALEDGEVRSASNASGARAERGEDREEANGEAVSGQGPRADDHVGEIYEVAGPQVLTLADVTELAYAAEGKPVTVLPVPKLLAKVGLTLADPLPFVPFGPDQARSLEVDNTVADNDATAFGIDVAEMTTLRSYLGLDESRLRASQPESA